MYDRRIPRGVTHIVGVDEAGRGPLAGPVAIGAVAVSVFDFEEIFSGTFSGVKESKQLSSLRREEWFTCLRRATRGGALLYSSSFGSARGIDRFGIVPTTARALARAVADLSLDPSRTLVLLDGGLKAPEHFPHQQTIIRGDESVSLIALASIVAKVLRDRAMVRCAKKYPEYGFERHKGYGTAFHYAQIEKYGVSPAHRKSFLRGVV